MRKIWPYLELVMVLALFHGFAALGISAMVLGHTSLGIVAGIVVVFALAIIYTPCGCIRPTMLATMTRPRSTSSCTSERRR